MDKTNAEFDAWFAQSGWTTSIARAAAREAWEASRAGVVVELPFLYPGPRQHVVEAIEAVGVKVAP